MMMPELRTCWRGSGEGDSRELFRRLLQHGMQELIDAELTAAIGAGPHERVESRSNQRNGSRSRLLSTPAGDIELRIPKVRVGSFFPSLLEPRRRVDRALWAVIMTAYVTGTSTRKVDDLVRALGCDSGVSKSTVSRICVEIDEEVAVFRTRPLGHVAMPYVYLDATYVKARSNHRIVSRAVVVATAVCASGDREVLGVDVGDSEDEVFWTAFLRGLRDRGLHGVRLVISDAHAGLKASISRVFVDASWQRCKVHLMRNLLGTVTSASKDMVAATVRTIFAQPDAATTRSQLHDVVGLLEDRFPKAAELLAAAEADVCAYASFPRALAQDRLDQPARAGQQRDQASLQRRGHLPRRRLGHPPRRRRPARTTRRLGRHRPPLPLRRIHGPDRSPQGGDPTRPPTARRVNSPAKTKGHRPTSTTPRGTARRSVFPRDAARTDGPTACLGVGNGDGRWGRGGVRRLERGIPLGGPGHHQRDPRRNPVTPLDSGVDGTRHRRRLRAV